MSPTTASSKAEGSWPFRHMVSMPWPFLVILPIAFAFLTGFGWSQDDYIEEKVSEIWVPKRGDYAKNLDYAKSVGREELSATSIAAMAISRDGENLFTPSRLEEIRERMEKTEATTIEWKGHTITWQDICALNNVGKGTTYEFPCARLSPMDLFQEARWFFDDTDKITWYNEVIRKLLLKPRIPRFGIMVNNCPAQCANILALRTNEEYAVSQGYPDSYADPLMLFDDIGSMEMNDPCKQCIEESFETTMTSLTAYVKGSFGVLAAEMVRLLESGTVTDADDQTELQLRAQQYGGLAASTTRADVEDFYTYATTRSLYAQFGTSDYVTSYSAFMNLLLEGCETSTDSLQCPPASVDALTAANALLTHADSDFSSVNTAGSPFPFWSTGDGTGALFEGSSPVSGSGVDLSGDTFSLGEYLDLENIRNLTVWDPQYSAGYADPITPDTTWTEMVESNPVYKWFMASLEASDNVCGNAILTGSSTSSPQYDGLTGAVMAGASSSWCTKYNIPGPDNQGDGSYSKQHFAKMWYNLLIDSDQFLGLTQGEDDPYSWTTGSGCGYSLGGQRDPYTNQTTQTILENASRELYYIDEGLSLGPIDRHLLIGDVSPSVDEYSFDNPLQTVGVIQTIYAGLMPEDIVERVKNCNRPGGPIDMTEDDATDILEAYKKAFEESWTEDWDDDNSGDVQFVLFADDSGAIGTTGRTLRDITLDNGKLMSISIVLIALFSVILLISPDWIESRVLITLVGVALVVLAFFASLGLAILAGIKINVTLAWTLPFIILGIGVDDVYIVLMSLKQQGGFTEVNFLRAMREVAVPVTMTSLVNCLMFAVLNISDIPAVYKTATVATICVIALYLSVIFCYPAYCWLDMIRQARGYRDVFFCFKAKQGVESTDNEVKKDLRHVWLYEKFYYPVVLGQPLTRTIVHAALFLGTAALLGVGCYGITQREVGLGLEDFFPVDSQAYKWAMTRTDELASWSISINWGQINYTDPETQLKMIKQFEDVVATEHVSETDTKNLWMANFLIWTTSHCTDNFDRENPDVPECGADQIFEEEGTFCTGKWMRNTIGLRNKIFPDPQGQCEPYEGGICRPTSEMFVQDLESAGYDPTLDSEISWCPVADWSDEKFKFCLTQWRNITGYSGGRFVFESEDATATECEGEYYQDEELVFPLPFSAGPTMFSYDLFSHELTLDMLDETRDVCDRGELHCWMTGIPYSYWTQYEDVFEVLLELSFVSAAVGFVVAWAFLFGKLYAERRHTLSKLFWGTLVGSVFITLTILTCLISVIGLSVLAGVSMTGFSNMAFVLSVGFAVEYAVHVVSRWLRAPNDIEGGLERVKYTMSFLMLPTFMSWISSTIGVVCMAFTQFQFTEVFFFRPLIIVMMVTYFVGCYALPALLTYINHPICCFGKERAVSTTTNTNTVEDADQQDKTEGNTILGQGSESAYSGSSPYEVEDIVVNDEGPLDGDAESGK